ncbi:MAG TPA: hypothetical protein VE979_10120, partial [Streptosporangiaceae bacterium]|nr:hypothetical protein [Streptosporangiaceae bacterium]
RKAAALFSRRATRRDMPAEPASERTAAALFFPGERSALRRSVSGARREGSAHSGPALASKHSQHS